MAENDFEETLQNLQSDDISLRAAVLKTLMISPIADRRIVPHLESLLTDKTPCLVSLPYMFGEMRWLAAQALAKEYQALGIAETVRLPGVVVPLSSQQLAKAEQDARLHGRGGVDGRLEIFQKLNEMGKLPLYDLVLNMFS